MRLERIIDIKNVKPGKKAVVTMPLGPTYEALHFDLNGGLVLEKIGTITVKADNKPVYVTSGANMLKHINYDGFPMANTKLTLDFTLPNAKSQGTAQGPTSQQSEMLLTSVATKLLQSFTVEMEIAADANVNSDINGLMQIVEPNENPFILKQFEANYSFASANTHNVLIPTGDSGGMIERLYLHTAGEGTIETLELKNNGVTITEATPEEIQYIQTTWYGKVQQANLLVLDFHLQGLRSKLFNTQAGRNTYMKIKTTDAMDLQLYSRFIDPINRKV